MGTTQSIPANRSFVLIGKLANGKSTLGNLILGGGVNTPFDIHKTYMPACHTKHTQTSETTIKSSLIYGDKFPEEDTRIQVVDQPGLGDPKYSLDKYSHFLIRCLKESNAEISTTFIITIKMSSMYFTEKSASELFDLAYFMSKFNYNFFSNAIIVFTHIDEIQLGEGIELNTDTLNTKLMEIMTRKSWKQLSELLQRVNNRYMFVNAMNREPGYREEILQKLFELSKPVVKATFHGSTGFTCEDLQTLFKDNSCDISHPKCHLQCTFCDFQCTQDNPNLESFVSRVRQLTHGISVIVLLINLNNDQSEQSLRLITGLPEYYKLGGDGESEFWKYTFLLFKFEVEQEDPIGYIHKQCERYGCIRELYEKSGKRATWVTEHMTRDQCIHKILEISQIIKQE
ncbi:GTPase IMAP family member 7-like isoform X2 [Oopsacas minuta]|uniref:GTPase IMAP family member 7-like isoform X2 n=1 Tax=Oopsacas minuta TaxID=111878 RepID=A0AAV7K7R4_9METZ|nr:GTPase IMAP family member 7-like isoform X2 [Oopsacas minuta]